MYTPRSRNVFPVITFQYAIQVRGKVDMGNELNPIVKYIAQLLGAKDTLTDIQTSQQHDDSHNFHLASRDSALSAKDEMIRDGKDFLHIYGTHKSRERNRLDEVRNNINI
ncbi:unnamed protein product [Leptidea sinapis]|uniref:Uncharacterized protein n=1 Tax=Leptidea sinapis TaxID=189913 RepID=A0A5E4QPL3_9NEOP|nr:unnamed protein product [Leptidea sinapis]